MRTRAARREELRAAWRRSSPEVGIAIIQPSLDAMSPETRPTWVAAILRAIRPLAPGWADPIDHVCSLADTPDLWPDARALFHAIRRQNLDDEHATLPLTAAVYRLLEESTRTITNSSNTLPRFDTMPHLWVVLHAHRILLLTSRSPHSHDWWNLEDAIFGHRRWRPYLPPRR